LVALGVLLDAFDFRQGTFAAEFVDRIGDSGLGESAFPGFGQQANRRTAADHERRPVQSQRRYLRAQNRGGVFALRVATRRTKDRKHGATPSDSWPACLARTNVTSAGSEHNYRLVLEIASPRCY